MLGSRWCYKSGPLKLIGQFNRDGIGCNTGEKLVSHWPVLVSFNPSIVR